jgi:hypothetical protein
MPAKPAIIAPIPQGKEVIIQIAVLPIPLSDKKKGVGIWEFTEERTRLGIIMVPGSSSMHPG